MDAAGLKVGNIGNISVHNMSEVTLNLPGRDAKIEEYRAKFAHPYIAAARGYIDDVIDPRETRARLISALDSLRNKRDRNPARKHGNLPL